MFDDDAPPRTYAVVRNEEEQYSLWPAGRPLPLGWADCGVTGGKEQCLEYIREAWTDLRPKSLREMPGY